MTLQTITVEVSPRRVATLTLNRPDRGNSFNQTLLDELRDQLARAAAPTIVCASSCCAAAAGISAPAPTSRRAATALQRRPNPPSRRRLCVTFSSPLDTLPKPTIAVVHGGALGGGAAVVACCDVALATEAAFFSIPGGAGRHAAARRDAVPHSRHGTPQLPPLRFLGRAYRSRRSVAHRPRA